MNKETIMLQKYFQKKSFVQSDIESFNDFIEYKLQTIIDENKEIVPTIIPPNIDDFRIRMDKIRVEKPTIVEADGSKRPIFPVEARLRKISYSAPCFLEISAHINGVQRESFEIQIGNIPIMLKSKFCHLHGASREELIKTGEDPDDLGKYFIINGTEKVLVNIEDLAANNFMVEATPLSTSKFTGKIFSEAGSYKIPHTLEKTKDSIFYLSFTRVKKMPLLVILKALGLLKDEELMKAVCADKQHDEVLINLYEFIDIKTSEDALDYIAKRLGITQSKDIRIERMQEILDKFLLPHIGMEKEDRLAKAHNICKMVKKFILVSQGEMNVDDKDHFSNKRLKMSGDLLADLFRVNLKVLIGDVLYNFQRIVKRGKLPSIKVIIREKLLTSRIYSAMATGNWSGGRKGVSQRIQRLNFLDTTSHLQRVVSPLSATQENFAARALHPTHIGRLCPLETPEGTNIGLKKNLALLATITKAESDKELIKHLKNFGLSFMDLTKPVEVFYNGRFFGSVDAGEQFVQQIIKARRKGIVTHNVNATYKQVDTSVRIENDSGRVRRPLIIVENGEPLLTSKHFERLEKGEIAFEDLVKEGVVEYVDALEEENAFTAFKKEDLTPEHTHLELCVGGMLGIAASLVPYANYNLGNRVMVGTKNQKQAIGFYAANFPVRMDMDVNLLYSPQKPIVTTGMHEIAEYDKHPSGQNIVVAIMSYKGYNMEDAVILNQASIDRGLGRSSYFRPAIAEELRYAGGMTDNIEIPDKEVKGYRSEHDYRLLEEDGIVHPEAKVGEDDVVIGKTSPPRFLSSLDEMGSYNLSATIRRENAVSLRHGEKGIVDFVLITENEEGNKLVQVRIRDERKPEVGDKFTSRFGQKGVIGLIVPQSDMPFSSSGVVPDLIFSPNGIPSRMTMSHVIELVGGKVGALSGRQIDGTTFSSEPEADLRKELCELGFAENGTESMYNPLTGEKFEVKIYIGNMYYLKLKHMVSNKLHSRARGPIQLLTRQPTEGRAKEGGLRLGEMEKDTFIAHGASLLLKERFDSDKTVVPIGEETGTMGFQHASKGERVSPAGDEEMSNVEMSYAFKLLLDELTSLGIQTKLKLKDKY
jgi:DNA-directed RNA polymerase subunit B